MAKKTAKKPVKAKASSEPKNEIAILSVSANAMSKDVGPVVLATLAATYAQENKAHAMLQEVTNKRYDALAKTTDAILKAAANDATVDLTKAFDNDKKTAQALNDQLQIALGIKEYQDIGGKKRLTYTKDVSRYFPTAKDKKDDPKTQQKATLRSNFIHMLKKCSQAACAMIDNKVEHSVDKESGTLKITGAFVKTKFGQDEVLLNEKQTITFDGNGAGNGSANVIQLKERPSFTALASMAAADHGFVLKKRTDARVSGIAVDANTAIASLCNSLVKAIGKLGTITNQQRDALESVRSALDKVLD